MQQGISGYLGASLAAGCGSCTPTAEPAVLSPRAGCLLSDYLGSPPVLGLSELSRDSGKYLSKQASPGGSTCGKGFV